MAAEQTLGVAPTALRAFEARFGNKEGEHALLRYPAEMREFFLRLFNKADLPDSAPPGASWEPFVRGWREDGYYLVALTEEDHAAARPGMIATRMLAVTLTQIEKWDDLGALFEILRETNRAYLPEFTIPSRPTKTPQNVSPALLACVAHRLIHEDAPVAIIGQHKFETLVVALWQKLPPELRRTFGFGFSFTPTDLTVTRANIVGVPASCEARWSSYSYKCNANWNQPLNDSMAAFLDEAQAAHFLGFLKDVGLVFHSFSDYGRYARLWNYWQKRNENNPEISYALLRSLGTLLPEPNQAVNQKDEAMHIAARLLKAGTHEGLLALRSVKASSFSSNGATLEDAVCEWLKSRFQSIPAVDEAGLAKVIRAVPSSQSAEWQAWVRKGLTQEFQSLSQNAAQNIWAIFNEEGILAEIGPHLPSDLPTETTLVRNFPPSLPAKLYSPLVEWCSSRGWICLMAKAALNHVGFAKAIELVFRQNEGKSRTAAIELLGAAGEPSEVWMSAFAHDDPTLLKCAVAAARAKPNLWGIDAPDINRWVALLDFATQQKPSLLREIDANTVTSKLFKAWEKGAPVTEDICLALEEAGRLEFVACANRDRLWAKLPKRFLAGALANTLRAWLTYYYQRVPTKPKLEKQLVEILFEPRHLDITFPRNSPALGLGGLMLIEEWGVERDCEYWLKALVASSTELPSDVAKRAGKLVTKRHWGHVAKVAKDFDERGRRHDLRVIWQTFYDSLGRLEKLVFEYFPSLSGARATAPNAPSVDLLGLPAPIRPTIAMKQKILFLAANPAGTLQLALDEECREITGKIRSAEHRDSLELITRWAVRPDDLLQHLNEHRPEVVHFSGHGTETEEIVLLDKDGNPRAVPAPALKQLFATLKDNVRVVVLNACFSRPQAVAITEVVDCAIGMNKEIGDEAAIAFAAAFYQAIGFGRSIKVAFESGKTALMLAGIPEENTPELLCKKGLDPDTIVLIRGSDSGSR